MKRRIFDIGKQSLDRNALTLEGKKVSDQECLSSFFSLLRVNSVTFAFVVIVGSSPPSERVCLSSFLAAAVSFLSYFILEDDRTSDTDS